MSGNEYVIVAFAAGIALLWGYAVVLGLALIGKSRRGQRDTREGGGL